MIDDGLGVVAEVVGYQRLLWVTMSDHGLLWIAGNGVSVAGATAPVGKGQQLFLPKLDRRRKRSEGGGSTPLHNKFQLVAKILTAVRRNRVQLAAVFRCGRTFPEAGTFLLATLGLA